MHASLNQIAIALMLPVCLVAQPRKAGDTNPFPGGMNVDLAGSRGIDKRWAITLDYFMLMCIAQLSYHPHLEVLGWRDGLDAPFTCLPRAGVQSREKNHLPALSLSLPARHAEQAAASLGRSEKLVRRSIALDEACVATAPRTIVLKRLKRRPK
jgi:hypothetical protein